MRFKGNKPIRVGALFIRLGLGGKRRFTSWGLKLGRYTYNATRRTSTFDTPGPGYVQHQHGRRSK